ncbi:unnamed protein product [Alternaria alternata]
MSTIPVNRHRTNMPEPGGAPSITLLRNGRDVDPSKPRIRIELGVKNDLLSRGKVDLLVLDDNKWFPAGHVIWPEGNSTINGVPIIRNSNGIQELQMVWAAPDCDADGKFSVDANNNPIFHFFVVAGLSWKSVMWPHRSVRLGDNDDYVVKVYILDLDLIIYAEGPGGVLNIYKAVHKMHYNAEEVI